MSADVSEEAALVRRPASLPLRARQVLPVGVSLACLGLLAWLFWARLPAVWGVVRGMNTGAVALALVPYVAGFYILAERLRVVFAAFGIRQPSRRFFLYTLVGLFFSTFLPTAMGGDVLKASYAAGAGDRLADALLATFVDRGIGLLGLLLVGGVGVLFFPSLQGTTGLLWAPVILAAGLLALVWIGRRERLATWALGRIDRVGLLRRLQADRLLQALIGLARRPGALALSLALTFVANAVVALSIWILARALGLETSYLIFLLLLPVLSLTLMLPSINGIGVREVTFVVVLRGLAPEEGALALALLVYGLGLATGALGGLVFLLRRPLGLALSPALTGWLTRRKA